MLSRKDNFLETIKGGSPDRFVKQFEFMELIVEAPLRGEKGGEGQTWHTNWGVKYTWPKGQIGGFPVHDEESLVIKNLDNWENELKIPEVVTDPDQWEAAVKKAEAVDRDDQFVASFYASGVFEMTHMLLSMEEAMMGFYLNPEAMKDIIQVITDFELDYAEVVVEKLNPKMLFHHDDWGSQRATLMSPETFREFIKPAYEQIYSRYRELGVEYIVHHSDSYAATLVPDMIDLGIDVWQGVMEENDCPALVKEYGGQISFMGDLNSGKYDYPDWSQEEIHEGVQRACKNNGKLYFIPNLTQGGPYSSFPGVYDCVNDEIDRASEEMF